MNRSSRTAPTLLALLLGLLSSCGGAAARPATRAQLRQGLEGADSIEIQDSAGSPASVLHDPLVAAARSLEARLEKQVILSDVVSADSSRAPRIVVGCPTDPGLEGLFLDLGGVIDGDDISFGGVALKRDSSILYICDEDPDRPGLPVQLIVARVRGALVDVVEDLMPRTSPGAVVFGRRSPRVQLDPSTVVRGQGLRREGYPQFNSSIGGGGIILHHLGGVPNKRAQNYKARALRALNRVAEWTGAVPEEKLEILAVSTGERLRRFVGDLDLAVSEGIRSRRMVLLGLGIPDDHGAVAARWAAVERLGVPRANWLLDGIAIDAADHWWGRPLEEWGRYLAVGELLPSVPEIISSSSVDRISQHALAPARGLFLRYLRLEYGTQHLAAIWRGEKALPDDEGLQRAFLDWLVPEGGASTAQRDSVRAERAGRLADQGFIRGVALDSNVRLGGGYDTQGVFGSLKAAQGLTANAVSITSFYTEDPRGSGAFGGRVPLGRSCIEGDIAVAQVVSHARRLGISTYLLQPHLLISKSTGYSAWLRRTSREHWDEFFDVMDRMLVHYGLLAELCGVDILCVGTNLSTPSANSGLDAEVKQHHDERWERALDLARQSFGGALTYAASWPGEASNLRFWQKLDYVGISLFPRIRALDEAPLKDTNLLMGWHGYMQGIDELARSVGRPPLIVEMGVRSTEKATTETSVGTGALALDEQERSWTTFASALATRRAEGGILAGLFVWKWPSEARGGGMGDRGYTPQNKPAAWVLPTLAPEDGSSSQDDEGSQDDR